MNANVSTQNQKQNSKTPKKSTSLAFFFISNLDEQLRRIEIIFSFIFLEINLSFSFYFY